MFYYVIIISKSYAKGVSDTMSKRKPIYITISNDIFTAIQNGDFSVGDQLPTESDLMAEYSVSRMTAKKSLDLLVQKELIVRYPGKGSFVISEPEKEDQTIEVNNEKKMVGVVLPTVYPCFGTELLYQISHQLQKHNIYPIYAATEDEQQIEKQTLKEIQNLPIEGLIIWPAAGKYIGNEILKLVLADFPVVLLDRYIQDIETNYVVTDNKQATISALNHLIDLKHQKIAIFSKKMNHDSSIKDRIHNAKNYLSQIDITNNYYAGTIEIPNKIDYSDIEMVNENKKELTTMLKEFLVQNPDTTAFFVTEYYPATLLYDLLTDLSFNVPKDFSIVCFDSPTFYLEHAVRFTHIRQNEKDLSNKSVSLLLNALENTSHKEHALLPADLIIGQTTAERSI